MFSCFLLYVHDVMIFDDLYLYFTFNIIIHYIILCYLLLAFVGDVCGIFMGCAISLRQISHSSPDLFIYLLFLRVLASYLSYIYCFCMFLPHISHISTVFACSCLISLISLPFLRVFDVLIDNIYVYIHVFPFPMKTPPPHSTF